jgi:hypothetical protein
MKRLTLAVVLGTSATAFVALTALATATIDLTPNALTQVQAGRIFLFVDSAPAQKLFDALTVKAQPGWMDQPIHSKGVAGFGCVATDQPENRMPTCTFSLDRANGFTDAAKDGTAGLTLSLAGKAANEMYAALQVPEEPLDLEGSGFRKSAPGIICYSRGSSGAHDCAMMADPAKGMLR